MISRVVSGILNCAIIPLALSLAQCPGSVSPEDPDDVIDSSLFKPVLSSSSSQVRDFLLAGQGGMRAKLVFVNNTSAIKRLCYIDFSEPGETPQIHTINAVQDPAVPVISPDGNWVVYASGNGAEAGSPIATKASTYLCKIEERAIPVLIAKDSAREPRFVQNNGKVNRLTIIYSTQAPNFAWEGFGVTMQVDVDLSGAKPVPATPVVLCPYGGYTGGLSWESRFLCGGGGHIAMLDLESGKTRPDTLSHNLVQSCNASISSSRIFTNTMMNLDFGSNHPAINNGKPWQTWQTILINNSQKQVVKGYVCPIVYQHPIETDPTSLSKVKWHHCEWSNHPYFAAATVNTERYFKVADKYENTFYQERLYLINLRDSAYIEIVRPDTIVYDPERSSAAGFYWPWLWVEVPAGFTEEAEWLKAR
jgi:hypothetical protein